MVKKYDPTRFKEAVNLIKVDPQAAKIVFERYIDEFKEDGSAKAYYAYTLIVLGLFDEAQKVVDAGMKFLEESPHYASNKRKYILDKKLFVMARIRILSYTERYQELLEFLRNSRHDIKQLEERKRQHINALEFYCKRKLGIINWGVREGHPYLFRQIEGYSRQAFKENNQRFLTSSSGDNLKPKCFVPDFLLDEVLKEIEQYLPHDNFLGAAERLYCGFYEDDYIFKLDGCGFFDGETTDYFRVVCFHGTNEIITMIPASSKHNLPHIDLNYINKNNSPKDKLHKRRDKRFGFDKKTDD